MLLPGRHANTSDYRYGFQGQEMDDEIKGEGNSVNYTFRMHDPRVGRFFAMDPLVRQYAHYSPYQFSGNKVIAHRELEGKEELISIIPNNQAFPKLRTTSGKELAFLIISETIEQSGERIIQKSIQIALSEMETGRLIASDGKVYVNPQMNKYDLFTIDGNSYEAVRRGQNFGFVKEGGEVVTTRGIDQIASQTSKSTLNKVGKVLSNAGFLFDLIAIAQDISESGEVDPFTFMPLSFVVKDMFEEDTQNLKNSIVDGVFKSTVNGLKSTSGYIQKYKHNYTRSFEIVMISDRSLGLLLSGEVTDMEQLYDDIYGDNYLYEERNNAVLIEKVSAEKHYIHENFISDDEN
tara:strand:+ start:8328 stop:9374 length:1047 start_codon:yes stop_codon:yes gene_type:complete